MEDLSLRLQMLISKLRSHGVTIDEEEAASKYLHSVPMKYIQIALFHRDDAEPVHPHH